MTQRSATFPNLGKEKEAQTKSNERLKLAPLKYQTASDLNALTLLLLLLRKSPGSRAR